MKLITENFLNNLSNKMGNLSDNQKIGLGAASAGGLAAGALGVMGHDLSQEQAELAEKFGPYSGTPTVEIQAGALNSLKDGTTTIKDVLTDKTRILQGDHSISLDDAKNQVVNEEKLKALGNYAPGVIGGAAAVGAIGAKIGSHKPAQ